jgi:hypothetical protein
MRISLSGVQATTEGQERLILGMIFQRIEHNTVQFFDMWPNEVPSVAGNGGRRENFPDQNAEGRRTRTCEDSPELHDTNGQAGVYREPMPVEPFPRLH